MLDNVGRRAATSLNNKYLRVGQSSNNRLFGIPPAIIRAAGPSLRRDDARPIQMLVSDGGKINCRRLSVVIFGLFTLAVGIVLSSIPWLDYILFKNVKLLNGTLSYYYWQKPGVMRLTKVFVFNVTNSEAILHSGQKPKLEEVGPFVFRENMEKVNVQFHDNGTVSFQHKKLLHFVPEMSSSLDTMITIPNIPLLTLTSMLAKMPLAIRFTVSVGVKAIYSNPVFARVTANDLMFGYDDRLTNLANIIYPKSNKPPPKLGLLFGRNNSLISDIATIYSGKTGMDKFGLMDKLNGLDHLPNWNAPCNTIAASEGSFFPPRDVTHSDTVKLWDRDLCRAWTFRYRKGIVKDGINADYYTLDDEEFESDAPLFTSLPHFMGITDPKILNSVEGMKPDKEKHTSYAIIQPKIGVPLAARIRVQVNLKVTQANNATAGKFPSIMFPILWVEEGVKDLTNEITWWVYLGTTVANVAGPVLSYGTIVIGASVLALSFITTYKNVVLTRQNFERGKRHIRRGSSFLVNGQHRLLILRDSYTLLQNTTAETSFDPVQEPESPLDEGP